LIYDRTPENAPYQLGDNVPSPVRDDRGTVTRFNGNGYVGRVDVVYSGKRVQTTLTVYVYCECHTCGMGGA